jgi:hypothetical protein
VKNILSIFIKLENSSWWICLNETKDIFMDIAKLKSRPNLHIEYVNIVGLLI